MMGRVPVDRRLAREIIDAGERSSSLERVQVEETGRILFEIAWIQNA